MVEDITNTYRIDNTSFVTRERSKNDWIGYLDGFPGLWEAGKTEVEALGRIVRSVHFDRLLVTPPAEQEQ